VARGSLIWNLDMLRTSLIALALALAVSAQTLQQAVDAVAQSTLERFRSVSLNPDEFAITVIDLNGHAQPASSGYHANQPFYPASVVKLFYLVAAHAWMESGKLTDSPELERAIHDMIVSSSNDATQLVFSSLTGTTGGPELTPGELQPWLAKREVVNQYFASLGYHDINVNQPTFAEDPYGRERQARGPNFENNNRLTTAAVARLWLSIVEHKAATPRRDDAMLALLHRDPFQKESTDEQATSFFGKSLPPGSRYYSKAGWTSAVRHDSAWIRLPNGAEYILVAFTRDHSKQEDILPFVSARMVSYFRERNTPH
jgi:beta-lactamase class A